MRTLCIVGMVAILSCKSSTNVKNDGIASETVISDPTPTVEAAVELVRTETLLGELALLPRGPGTLGAFHLRGLVAGTTVSIQASSPDCGFGINLYSIQQPGLGTIASALVRDPPFMTETSFVVSKSGLHRIMIFGPAPGVGGSYKLVMSTTPPVKASPAFLESLIDFHEEDAVQVLIAADRNGADAALDALKSEHSATKRNAWNVILGVLEQRCRWANRSENCLPDVVTANGRYEIQLTQDKRQGIIANWRKWISDDLPLQPEI